MTDLESAESFADIITMIRHARRRGTCQFSYRQLADKLGYRSPRTLAMVHKGQRPPSQKLIKKIVAQLNLQPHEGELVRLLAEKAIAESKRACTDTLNEAIRRRRLLAQRLQEIRNLSFDESLRAFIFVSEAEKELVRQQLEIFFVEVSARFAESTEGKEKYEFTVSAQPVRGR